MFARVDADAGGRWGTRLPLGAKAECWQIVGIRKSNGENHGYLRQGRERSRGHGAEGPQPGTAGPAVRRRSGRPGRPRRHADRAEHGRPAGRSPGLRRPEHGRPGQDHNQGMDPNQQMGQTRTWVVRTSMGNQDCQNMGGQDPNQQMGNQDQNMGGQDQNMQTGDQDQNMDPRPEPGPEPELVAPSALGARQHAAGRLMLSAPTVSARRPPARTPLSVACAIFWACLSR